MRKFLLSLITITLMLPCSAYASNPWYFWFDSQCGPAPTFGFAQQYQKMDADKSSVEIRHYVIGDGTNVGFTNLLTIHERGTIGDPVVGAKWCVADGMYYSMNVTLLQDHFYAPCGRANTRYYDQFGLTSVRIEGHWRVN